MRLTYDKLPAGRRHPLGREAVRGLLVAVAADAPAPIQRLRAIHFGWNGNTTQEGRVVQRGQSFEIRVNFTVESDQSRFLRHDESWLLAVTRCGGIPDSRTGLVHWTPESAERYGRFLVLHELAHAVYAQSRTNGRMEGGSTPLQEERFCDQWALARIESRK